jgi:hypothetical protein
MFLYFNYIILLYNQKVVIETASRFCSGLCLPAQAGAIYMVLNKKAHEAIIDFF